jgi:hypothetical protein
MPLVCFGISAAFTLAVLLGVAVPGVAHKESSLQRARIIAARAIEVYSDPTSRLPSCGVGGSEEGYLLRAQSSQSPLPSGEKAIRVNVSNESKNSVSFDDINVSIDFRPDATDAGYEAICWWQWVVVT